MSRLTKKAQTFTILQYYAIRIPIILILVVIFIYVSSTLESRALSGHDIRTQVILNRIFYSPNSITVYDEISGRVNPSIVDLNKFRDVTLDSAFSTRLTNAITGKLDLKDLENDETFEAYINKEQYDRWKHYTKFEQYDNFIDRRYVLILTDEGLHKGVMKINFVLSNE